MKICTKCNKQLEYSEFYKHAGQSADGYYSWCKKCFKGYMKQQLQKTIEKRVAYTQKYRRDHPSKYKAHSLLQNMIVSRKIIKRNICETCYSTENIECHHEDYNKPLDFIELCCQCHKELHKQYREKEIVDQLVPVMQV